MSTWKKSLNFDVLHETAGWLSSWACAAMVLNQHKLGKFTVQQLIQKQTPNLTANYIPAAAQSAGAVQGGAKPLTLQQAVHGRSRTLSVGASAAGSSAAPMSAAGGAAASPLHEPANMAELTSVLTSFCVPFERKQNPAWGVTHLAIVHAKPFRPVVLGISTAPHFVVCVFGGSHQITLLDPAAGTAHPASRYGNEVGWAGCHAWIKDLVVTG
jgi:hypothetical protein